MDVKKNGTLKNSLTILLTAGRLPAMVLGELSRLRERFAFELYLSTAQNLRLFDIADRDLDGLRGELVKLGLRLKGPGKFPLARVCIGRRGCKLGIIDTHELAERIDDRFGGLAGVKPKFKIALAGCPASCTSPVTTDIGVMATRRGFDLYVGGKGGPGPRIGRRVLRQVDEEQVLAAIGELVEFHSAKTSGKQRMCKLLDEPGFPFRAPA